jgi:NhaP-type Na+/H+ or K+/H+ antiporter
MANEENISYFLVFFAALLAVVVIFQKWLHDRPSISSFLPEAAMVLGMGMIFGFFIHLMVGKRVAAQALDDDSASQEVDLKALLSFSPSVFFVALLPPILFNSGLRIGPLFFRHLAPICLFSVVGTTISALSTAFILKAVIDLGFCGNFQPSLVELLCFGSLISSTDPISTLAVFQAKKVDPQLFYLVFGESALNDALAIVLFDSFSRFVAKDNDAEAIALGFAGFFVDLFLNCFGSLFLGGFCGLCTAYLFKQLDMRQNRLMEISLYLLLVYIPFLLAEVLNLSGIVTILFTGVAANRYVVPNLSSITKVNADMLFRLLAHLAETSIFLELGLSVFGLIGHWNWEFIGWSLFATLIGRGLNIVPLSFLFNQCLLRGGRNACASDNIIEDDNIMQYRRAFSPVGVNQQGLGNFVSPYGNALDSKIENPPLMYASSFGEISIETATPMTRKDLKIRSNTCAMVWYSGLRGAVSYACSRSFPDESKYKLDFIMTTMALVVITVFMLGGTTELALSFLRIDVGVDEDTYMRESLKEPLVSNKVTDFEQRHVFPRVVRDYHCMHGIQSDPRRALHQSHWQRPRTPIDPTIEMTESGYLETTKGHAEEVGKSTDERVDMIGLLVRQDTLFDYGAQ